MEHTTTATKINADELEHIQRAVTNMTGDGYDSEGTASRLTAIDHERIAAAAREAVAAGAPHYIAQLFFAHAMGCSLHDLSDTELAAIDRHITVEDES